MPGKITAEVSPLFARTILGIRCWWTAKKVERETKKDRGSKVPTISRRATLSPVSKKRTIKEDRRAHELRRGQE